VQFPLAGVCCANNRTRAFSSSGALPRWPAPRPQGVSVADRFAVCSCDVESFADVGMVVDEAADVDGLAVATRHKLT